MGGQECYCNGDVSDEKFFLCCMCKKRFHEDCLHSRCHSPLEGDYLFTFTCSGCSASGEESYVRPKLSWLQVVSLALFNLQLQESGRQGYFRWREHICAFIGHHWDSLFGFSRKKSGTWQSTIAGVLSSNSSSVFLSGMSVFREPGWWCLAQVKPPTFSLGGRKHTTKGQLSQAVVHNKNTTEEAPGEPATKRARLATRDASFSSVTAPQNLLLDEAEDSVMDDLDIEVDVDDSLAMMPAFDLAETVKSEIFTDDEDSSQLKDEGHHVAMWDQSLSAHTSRRESLSSSSDDSSSSSSSSDDDNGWESRSGMETANRSLPAVRRPAVPSVTTHVVIKAKETSSVTDSKPLQASTSCTKMSAYREALLLKELEELVRDGRKLSARCARFYRKLAVRKAKRGAGLPVFDLSTYLKRSEQENQTETVLGMKPGRAILDRYQMQYMPRSSHSLPFSVRLVGSSNDQHEVIRSPYTARILKPYIWRNYECQPAKLKLLNEIVAYAHRSEPNWMPAGSSPIDYCYVRPEHIPTLNAMCHRFFWPGIDLSECLQYPDFSCVALYKKLIVGFAFMVPDVKYNEAYISFIFTHPEWRGAGISSFMLYHLIQTCMGKDVTLHVSATNPAVMLYHKFGFKTQELILNFYDKYLPLDAVDCRHALALKLEK